jgi:hypothetical protein
VVTGINTVLSASLQVLGEIDAKLLLYDGWMDGRIDGWMDGWMDEMDECMKGWMDGWTDG